MPGQCCLVDPMADSNPSLEHEECRQMSLALEGLAGAIHANHPVEARDLAAASHAAESVWQAGPDPGSMRDADFEAAREAFNAATTGCAQGLAKESAAAERAAQQMALELRWMGKDLARKGPRLQPPRLESVITRLQVAYGRYGYRPRA
jgi:hypothetical protein